MLPLALLPNLLPKTKPVLSNLDEKAYLPTVKFASNRAGAPREIVAAEVFFRYHFDAYDCELRSEGVGDARHATTTATFGAYMKSLVVKRSVVLASHKTSVSRGGPGCLNGFSASISGASARVRLPSGVAAG